jgi:uncharacterized protein YigA (DUF484 family)
MNIEDRIRSRIEAILINDARNYAEIKGMAEGDEPFGDDSFEEERNLYQRIINNYRSAISEVNQLLEENVDFLSGFYRLLENIKEKRNFQEICVHVVECVLQDFGAEYCSMMFMEPLDREGDPFCLEGMREERKFLRIHAHAALLGSTEFEQVVAGLVAESSECLNIPDVYREPRFNAVDFPSVVRSLACLPISLGQRPVGVLILSNSLPHYFKDSHIRTLKILTSIVAHLRLLTPDLPQAVTMPRQDASAQTSDNPDTSSIILLDFEQMDVFKRSISLDKEKIRIIRKWLVHYLGPRESILFKWGHELIIFLPGTTADILPARVVSLREALEQWKAGQAEKSQNIRMSIGFSTCEEGEDLAKALEIASAVMHPELGEGLDLAAEN